MKDSFYLTLPSNSSFDVFPNNTTACYVTQLPQRISLLGDWEISVVEFHYPRTLLNINSTNNIIYFGGKKEYSFKRKIPIGYYSLRDLVSTINTIDEFKKFTRLSVSNNKVMSTPLDDTSEETDVNLLKETPNLKNESYSNVINEITLQPNLALLLGFDVDVNLLSNHVAPRSGNVNLGVANQIYLYCDIAEGQYVGDSVSPLLRIIHVDKSNYSFGSQMVSLFDSPHYVNLIKNEFETVEIDLRIDSGLPVPFLFGNSTVKLHFRKQSV